MILMSLENNNWNGLNIGFIFIQAWNIGKIMLESGFIFTQAWNKGKNHAWDKLQCPPGVTC